MKRSMYRGLGAALTMATLAVTGLVGTTTAAAAEPNFSTTYLRGVHAQLDAELNVPGTAWRVDPETKTVAISYNSSVAGANLAQLRAIKKRHGNAVRLEHTPGRSTKMIGGGVGIYRSSDTTAGSHYCTLGFNAIKDGEYYFFTAGHCTNASVWWYAGANQQGQLGYRVTSIHPGRDIGIVKYTNASVPKPGVVARYDGTVQDITHAREILHDRKEFVCKAGATTGYTCGYTEKELTTAVYDDGTKVYGVIEANLCATHGDSGAPLHSGTAALGVLSGGIRAPGSNCGRTWFERVTEFQAGRGINVY